VKITVEVLCKEYAIKENAFVVMDLQGLHVLINHALIPVLITENVSKDNVNVKQDLREQIVRFLFVQMNAVDMECVQGILFINVHVMKVLQERIVQLENVLMIARLEEHVYKKPMKQFVNVIQDFLELTAPKKDAQMIAMIMEFV
jgi:hypothetical protein